MDGVRKREIYHDTEISQVSYLDTRLIVRSFLETGNPGGRAELELKTGNSVWEMLI